MLQRPAQELTATRSPEETVEVELRTSPTEALIELDGKPSTNPLLLKRRKGSPALRVRISATGHLPRELDLGFGESKSWRVALDWVPESQPATQPVAGLEPRPKKVARPKVLKLVTKKKGEKKDEKKGIVKDLFKNPYGS
jgi:hypothetical protein